MGSGGTLTFGIANQINCKALNNARVSNRIKHVACITPKSRVNDTILSAAISFYLCDISCNCTI